MADLGDKQTTDRPATKLSRAKRNDVIRKRLFDAAAKVVGRLGYAEASVARITELAETAQGTFYNHFDNRQALLDELLPTIGGDMVEHIRGRAEGAPDGLPRESARFRAFFEFLLDVPEFQRILNEAEVFAPAGYQRHLETVAAAFVRILKRARDAGEIRSAFTDPELEAVAHILLGARGYLSRRYAYTDGTVHGVPDHVISAYEKLIGEGLFGSTHDEREPT